MHMYASVVPTGCGKTPGLKALRAANATPVHHSNPFYLSCGGGGQTRGTAAAVVPVADSLNAFLDTRLDRTRRSVSDSYRSERKRQADRAREFTARNLEHVIYDAPVEFYSGRPADPSGAAREAFQRSVEEQNMSRRTPRHADAAKDAPPPSPVKARKPNMQHQMSHVDEVIFGRDMDESGHMAAEAAPRKVNISHMKSQVDEVIWGRDMDATRASTPKVQAGAATPRGSATPRSGATPRGSGAVTPTRGAAATIEAGIQLAKEAALRKEMLLAQGQHVATPGAATPKSAAGSARSSGERRAESRASADAPAAGASTKRWADSREATPRGTPRSSRAPSSLQYAVQMRSGADEIMFGRDIDYSGPVAASGEKKYVASTSPVLPVQMRSGADELIFGRDLDMSSKMA